MNYYPVFIPTLNRFSHFKNCVESLSKCTHADKTELVIGLDYPPSDKYMEGYKLISDYVGSINGFAKVTIFKHDVNLGTKKNSEYLANYCRMYYKAYIYSEDDNVFAPAFLDYMDKALDLFYDNDKIDTVSGYNSFAAYDQGGYGCYLCKDHCSWGTGYWVHKEKSINKIEENRFFFKLALHNPFWGRKIISVFPTLYLTLYLMTQKGEHWGDVKRSVIAILKGLFQLRPAVSLVRNCGYDGTGMHCSYDDNYINQYISEDRTFDISKGVGPSETEVNRLALYNQDLPTDPEERKKRLDEIFYLYKQNTDVVFKIRQKLAIRTRIKKLFRRFFCTRHASFGAILMLHRVDVPNPDGIWYNQHLKMSPQTINEMVKYARERKCEFVSINALTDAIKKKKRVRRWIVLTLDDGYRDNYKNGSPLFQKLNVPYVIYVCTKMVKKEMCYWWEILEQLLLKNEKVVLSDGREFDCSTKDLKNQSFLAIREIILGLSQNNIKDQLRKLFVNYDIDFQYGNETLGLTWQQICELKKDSHATIGNHTYSHNAFSGCTDKAIIEDIELATKEMKENTKIEMIHFAFPYGEDTAVSQHDIELVKGLGFKTSATTKDGYVCYGTDPLELPRIFVTEKNWKQVIDRVVTNC